MEVSPTTEDITNPTAVMATKLLTATNLLINREAMAASALPKVRIIRDLEDNIERN